MKTSRGHWAVLWIIFLAVASLRLFLAFQTPLPDYVAFDELRQMESIRSRGVPLYDDPLSQGGRERVFPPLYHYLLAIVSFVVPSFLVVKIIPNLFAAALVFPVFLLLRFITSRVRVALAAAAMAALVPAAFYVGVNDGSSTMLGVSLLFLACYLFLKSRKSGKHLNALLVTLVVMSLVNAMGFLFLISLLVYMLLLKIERMPLRPKEVEIFLFFLFFSSWAGLLIYKRAFLVHGVNIIWQNAPAQELFAQFSSITLWGIIVATGLVPLVAGASGFYVALSRKRKKSLVLLSSVLLTTGFMVWLKLMPLAGGLAILSTALAVAGGYALFLLGEYVRKTRASWAASVLVGAIVVLFLVIALPGILSIRNDAPLRASFNALHDADLPEDAVVLAVPQEGSFVAYATRRATVIDEDFLLAVRAQERYEDVLRVYDEYFKAPAIGVMQKYGATHLLVSQKSVEVTGVESLRFVDEECFPVVVDDAGIVLFERACDVSGGEV